MNHGLMFLSCYFLSSLFCYGIDILVPDSRVKMIPKSIVNREYLKMLPLCSSNALIGTVVLSVGDNYLLSKDTTNDHYFLTNIILWLVVTDFWFYVLHRLFHTKILYRYHRVHHDYSYTFGMGAIYAHPVDFLFTNLFPVGFPILFFNIPYYHAMIITIFSTCYTTVISHGGYKINACRGHLIHHVKRKHNYGLLIFDRVLGTHQSSL